MIWLLALAVLSACRAASAVDPVAAAEDASSGTSGDAAAGAETAGPDAAPAVAADVPVVVEPAHPHVWPVAGANYATIKPLMAKYCTSCHGTEVKGAARHGAPAHETLDDPDVLKLETQHVLDYTTDPPGVDGKPMPPAGAPQPTAEERAQLVAWLKEGARTQADFCFRGLVDSGSRIVTTPTAGGRADIHLSLTEHHSAASPDILQKGDMVQGRYPVPVGSTVRIRASRPPLGYARQPVTLQWLRNCQPVDPPAGAVFSADGVLTWTPGWGDIDDHVVQINAPGGDDGREIVIAPRPNPPTSTCHDDSNALAVSVTLPAKTTVASMPLAITVQNQGGEPVRLTDIATRSVAVAGSPDTMYPALPKGQVLQPGEKATFSSLVCAFPSLDLPDRPARYFVTVSGENLNSKEPVCGTFVSDDVPIAGAVPAPAGRELPELEEVARLMGLLQEDETGKSLLIADFNLDGRIDIAFSNMGRAPRLLLATGDALHFKPAGDLAYDGTLGIAAGLVDVLGDGVQHIINTNWPDFADPTKFAPRVELHRNDGTGKFTVDFKALATSEHIAGRNVAVLDYDNDGFEDVYVTTIGGFPSLNEERPDAYKKPTNLLFRNNGDGSFAEVGAAANARGTATATALAVIDANEDGWPDLFVGGYGEPLLLINQTNGTFAPKKLDTSGWKIHYQMPQYADLLRFSLWEIGWGDFNADGHTDVVGGGWLERGEPGNEVPHHVWIGDGKGGFKLDAEECNLGHADPCLSSAMGLQVGDMNDDGYPEIFMGGGGPEAGWHHQMWLNATPKPGAMPHFLDRTNAIDFPASGATTRYPYRGHGGTFMDLDGDLDLDFVQGNGGMDLGLSDPGALEAWRVFLNGGNPHGKLELDLRGFPSNRNAVGARVEVDVSGGTGPQMLRQWMFPNNGFPGANLAGRMHFGLFDAKQIAEVRVLWPDGQLTLHHPGLNSHVQINEKDALRFGADFRTGRDGFDGGGEWTARAICFKQPGTATHPLAAPAVATSFAARVQMAPGGTANAAASLALTAGTSGVTLHVGQESVVLQAADGKTAKAPQLIQNNQQLLVRLALEVNGSGGTDAVAYVNTHETVRLANLTAFAPTQATLGGDGVCWSLASVR